MKFLDPVAGVGDEKLANEVGAGSVEVDGLAPLVFVTSGEVVVRELFEIVAVGTEVVVNDVENHAETGAMRPIDESAEVVGSSIEMGRSEQIHAVITPSEPAWKFGDRHEFEQRDSRLCQLGQNLARSVPGSFLREGSDMHFINHLSLDAN